MRTALKDCLEIEGHRVLTAADGEAGLKKALDEKPDLVLLDIMMPRLDGYAVCTELRRVGNGVPVLMLTAKGQVDDRVTGLDSGADDYLVKPFSTEELLARVRALLRRTQRQARAVTTLALGDTKIDLVKQTASRGRKQLHLTAKEFAMLRLLAETPGEPVSRERFLDVVWGYGSFPTTRTVDNHIASLRAKVETDPNEPRWIKTVHGVGYRLEAGKAMNLTNRECHLTMYNIVQLLRCCATTVQPPAASRREPAPQRAARLNRIVKIATEKVPYRQTPEAAASYCTQSARGKTAGSPLLGLARLSSPFWEKNWAAEPRLSLEATVAEAAGKFGLIGFRSVLCGFGECDFPKKNAKKCGFGGFRRFLLGPQKSERGGPVLPVSSILQNHDKRRRQNLQNDGGMGNRTYED